MTTEYEGPSDAKLREEVRTWTRTNTPKDYREMRKANELDEYIDLVARSTRDYAETLISQGEWAGQAWITARRQIIAGRETD